VSFVGGGWRSGQAGDITGVASTATVTTLNPTTAARKQVITLTVTGTGFVNGAVVYAAFNPCATTFVSATSLTCQLNTTPDNGAAGAIPISVRNRSSEALSGSQNFTAT